MNKRKTPPVFIKEKTFVRKISPVAEFPYKERPETPIYNLTIVNRTENRAEDEIGHFNDFGIGLKITAPENHFLEVVAAPSLHKHGYMLPHPVIIDANHQGEVIVSLYKLEDKVDLELPFNGLKMILRPSIYSHIHSMTPLKHSTFQPTFTDDIELYDTRRPMISSKKNHMY
jgi:hypothetical protein